MAERPHIAVVGGESLLGAEVRDVLRERLPDMRVKLVGSEEQGTAVLTEEAGEAVVMTGIDADALAEARAVIFAGRPESTRRAIDILCEEDTLPVFIDMTGELEQRPDAVLRAPVAVLSADPKAAVQVIAHPAAAVLASVLRRLHAARGVDRAVATVLEPASERGRAGVDEMQKQATQLFTFKPLEKVVFGDQAAFNLLPRYGEEAPVALSAVEARVRQHLASLLAVDPPAPMPSVRLVQAPVMHGHSISLWVQLRDGVDGLEALFPAPLFDVRTADQEPPTPASAANQDGVMLSIQPDPDSPRAAWLWIVADNYRITAANAVIAAAAAV